MKLALRIFFALLLCFMIFVALSTHQIMMVGSLTVNYLAFSQAEKGLDSMLEIRKEREGYIQAQGVTKEVDQKIEKLTLLISDRSPKNSDIRTMLNKPLEYSDSKILFRRRLIFGLGCIIAVLYLMVAAGLFFIGLRNLKIVYTALSLHFIQFLTFLVSIAISALSFSRNFDFLLFDFLKLVDMIPQDLNPPSNLRLFYDGTVGAISGFWKIFAMFVIYFIICILYFRSSFYQDKEKVV